MVNLKGAKVVLLACGSFNPITLYHLRMFERARDYLRHSHGADVVEGVISPVADQFEKADLITAPHRIRMCELAVKSSSWIRTDGWESEQSTWTYTLSVLEHHQKLMNEKYGNVRLLLLCGADLIDSFLKIKDDGEPLWKPEHIQQILSDYGIVMLERVDATPLQSLKKLPVSPSLLENVLFVEDETFPNKMSSTRLRSALRSGYSIRYCTPDSVVDYIEEHNLYRS